MIRSCENSFLSNSPAIFLFAITRMRSAIESQIRRTRILSGGASETRLMDTVQEHLDIVKPAIKNDWEDAALAMQHHLSQSKSVMFDLILKKDFL